MKVSNNQYRPRLARGLAGRGAIKQKSNLKFLNSIHIREAAEGFPRGAFMRGARVSDYLINAKARQILGHPFGQSVKENIFSII